MLCTNNDLVEFLSLFVVGQALAEVGDFVLHRFRAVEVGRLTELKLQIVAGDC